MDKRSHKGADGDGSGSYMQYIRLPAGQKRENVGVKVEETDMGSPGRGLPHFNVAIESRKAVGHVGGPAVHLCQGGHDKAYQLYHGCAGGCPEPLDEIALSTLKEVASQCGRCHG